MLGTPFYEDENSALQRSPVASGMFAPMRPAHESMNYYSSNSRDETEQSTRNLYNPMLKDPVHSVITDVIPSNCFDLYSIQHASTKILTEGDFYDYAETLVSICKRIAMNRPHLVVVPLRGGITPGLQTKAMLRDDSNMVLPIPFTQGSQGRHDTEVVSSLRSALSGRSDIANIVVVDTASSGHGAMKLAELFLKARTQASSLHWNVHFHLLYERGSNHSSLCEHARRISGLTGCPITFHVSLHEVPSLITEDWDEGLGVAIVKTAGRPILREFIRGGEVLVQKRNGEVELIRTSALHRFITQRISYAVSEAMMSDPRLRYSHDVWRDYFGDQPLI